MAVPYYERLIVPDLESLKTLTDSTVPAITNGIFIAVADKGDGTPDWFYYVDTATDAESLPYVVTPVSGTGRWFLFSKKEGDSEIFPASYEGPPPEAWDNLGPSQLKLYPRLTGNGSFAWGRLYILGREPDGRPFDIYIDLTESWSSGPYWPEE